MADVLKAVGLAEMLHSWLDALGHPTTPILIEDAGDVYHIQIPAALDEVAVERIQQPFNVGRLQKFLGKKQQAPGEHNSIAPSGFLYEAMQAQRAAYIEKFAKLSSEARIRFATHPQADEFQELRALTPHPDLRLYAYLNHFKIADGYNTLLEQWRGESLESFRLNLAFVLDLFGSIPNKVEAAAERWDQQRREGLVAGAGMVTRWQLVNPSSGKGGNAAKANALGIGNLKGFWLLEFLKLVGLFTVGAPLMVTGSKDRKTYVLHPIKVELAALKEIMAAFRNRLLTATAVKLDILVALRFLRLLVEYRQQALFGQLVDPALQTLFAAPFQVADLARGFEVASYKDMGSAYAVMNLATIGFPTWPPLITTREDATAALALLDEQRAVIASIGSATGEEGTQELELLRQYRDFFSGREPERFFDFAAHFGDYALAKRRRNQWSQQLTTTRMELLMEQTSNKKSFLPLIENEGFQAIAAAIRRATVQAQYHAAREDHYPYEVRYGLGQELVRAAAYPEDFLEALSCFVLSYNAENARVDERIAKGSLPEQPRYRRRSVRKAHLNQIVKLLETYEAGLLCKLLVAYGYARDTATPGEQSPEEPEPDQGTETEPLGNVET